MVYWKSDAYFVSGEKRCILWEFMSEKREYSTEKCYSAFTEQRESLDERIVFYLKNARPYTARIHSISWINSDGNT